METVVARLITDKPVKKTAYQVKGVFMKHYPNSSIVPMLDGTYRNKFLYPRVQVKILNEQIYVVGLKEGADPVRKLASELTSLNFGNITFEVADTDIEETKDRFLHSDQLLRYKFVTPWVALGNVTQNRYKFLKNKDRIAYLNKLLGQNIVFLGREMGVDLNEKVYTKIKLTSLKPKPVDEDGWGAFTGEFQTNFILPDYIGIGNGITRGYGAVHGLYDPKEILIEKGTATNGSDSDDLLKLFEEDDTIKVVTVKTVPKPRRKNKKPKNNKTKRTDFSNNTKSTNKNISKKSEPKPNNDSEDRFNSIEYHKKQHEI